MEKMLAVITAIVMALSVPGFAQNHKVSIQVQDSKTRTPVVGATITGKQSMLGGQTRENGMLELRGLKAQPYVIQVSHLGYKTQTLTIDVGNTTLFKVRLQPTSYLTDEVFVQATRVQNNAASTYKNLSKADIEKNNLGQDLPYLLELTPGVIASSDAGAGVGYTNMRIRGSDNQRINVTINGIPYNDPESMGTFFVNMPDFASSVDNIQIQRGVGTSTNGAGAFGASVNIQTTQRRDSAYAELANSFGSYNTWKNTVSVGTGLINDKFSFDGRLSRIKSDGYIDRGSSNLKSFFLSGAWYGENSLLRANVFSGKEKTYQAWNGVPEALLETNRTFNEFDYENQTDNYTQTHYQLLYSNNISREWLINAALHYTRGQGYYEEYKEGEGFNDYGFKPIIIGDSTIDVTDLTRRRWLDNHFYGGTYSLEYTPNQQFNITVGGAYNRYLGNHFGEVIWARFASDHTQGDHYYDNDAKKQDFNIYTKANYRLGEWDIFADLQYRTLHYSYQGKDRDQALLQQAVSLHFFNPKLGLTYNLPQGGNIYLSAAIANKEPIRDDYVESTPDSRPQPERLHDFELGYRKRSVNLSLNVNAYAMLYKDQLITTGRINDVGAAVRENVSKSYRAGLELDAAWQVFEDFTWSLAGAFSQNKIRNYTYFIDENNADWEVISQKEVHIGKTNIAMSPDIVLANTLEYAPIKKGRIALINQYISRQYLDNTGDAAKSIDPYFLTHLRLNYGLSLPGVKDIQVSLRVNNIFSTLYESGGYTFSYYNPEGNLETYNYYFPQATANFMLGLTLKF